MAKANENMRLWSQVERTNPAVTKGADLGRMKITAISPQSQRKRATEMFGPVGLGWGVSDERYEFMDLGDTKLCTYHAMLWYVLGGERGAFPITANVKVSYMTKSRGGQPGYQIIDDEYAKKVSTNALTKGLSCLGFNSDVFEGKFDDCKYVQAMGIEFETDNKAVVPRVAKPDSLDTYKSLLKVAADEGGVEAFRQVWAKTQKVAPAEIKKCRDYIKNTPSEQEWLQGMKEVAAATDAANAEVPA